MNDISPTVAQLVLEYVDDQKLHMPELRATLATMATAKRINASDWVALLDRLAQAHPRPALGIEIGATAQPRHIGVLGYLATASDSAGDALVRFSRYETILHNVTPSEVTVSDEELVISWAPHRTSLLADEMLVAGVVAIGRWLIGVDLPPMATVVFPYRAPADKAPYEAYFGLPARFGGPALSVRLPAPIMRLPVNTRDPYLVGVLEHEASIMKSALPQTDQFVRELQRQLVIAMRDGAPTIDTVARRMAVAPRTLHRRLAERGLQYSEILNSLRFEMASDYLSGGRLTLVEIALLLGFSDQSAFSRAFKGWSGVSPLQYRRGERRAAS